MPNVESLHVMPVDQEEPGVSGKKVGPAPRPVLVTLHSISKDTDFSPATRDIQIGCVRTMAVSQKKNGEYTFDSLAAINALGFNIDPVKGMLEAGTSKPVTITWTP